MLPRDRLVQRLISGRDRRLLLVAGSAGSGKTSIVCQWIEKDRMPVAWYSLDDADNDPDLFLRYFLTSLGSLDARLRDMAEPWIEGQKRLKGADIAPILSQQLAVLPGDIYLVLDDYHLIRESEIHEFLKHLLARPLPKMHLVILSRHSLPFSVSRLKVRNQMIEISSEEMRFTYKETERFFSEILPVKLSAGQIQELMGHMEGWVGGLQLFGLALRGRKTVDALSAVMSRAYDEAADYLVDEVVETQPEKTRRFLQATALLDRFNSDLCRVVTGSADVPEMIDHAYRNNLFLVPLDSEGKWYRYHHLFTRAVRKKARISFPEECTRVYRSAALWFAANDYLEDAFRHAFAADDVEFAADMLEDYLMLLYERYEIASFRRWLRKLPREVYHRRALLRLIDYRFRIESVQLMDVRSELKEIEDHREELLGRYDESKRKLCEDLLLVFRRITPHWLDPENLDIQKAEAAFQQISPENKALSAFRTTIPFSYFYKGNMKRAAQVLREVSESVLSSGNTTATRIWFTMAATIERLRGHLRGSEKIVKDGRLFLGRSGESPAPLKFMLDLQMAWVHYLRDDLDKAYENASAVLRYVEQTRFLYEIVNVNYLLSLIFVAWKDPEKTLRSVQRMQRLVRIIGTPSLIALTDAYIARLHVAGENLREAEEWMKGRRLSPAEPFTLRFAHECLTQARVLSAQERHREALSILDGLRGRCVKNGMIETVLEMDILRSAALFALGDHHTARTVMEGAFGYAEPEGYMRPFVEHIGAIAPVLIDMAVVAHAKGHGHALKPHSSDSYLVPVMRACGIDEKAAVLPTESGDGGIAGLTRRELEILELMAAGYRDKEIAEKAFISLHTVRTHTKHILEKLDVKTRVQAVRRLEELGAGKRHGSGYTP